MIPFVKRTMEERNALRSRVIKGSCSDELFSHAIWDRVLFYVEADLRFFWQRRRSQEPPELLVNITQGAIVEKQGFINFGKAPQDGGRGASPHFFRQHRLEKNAGLTPTPKVAICDLKQAHSFSVS